MNDVDGLERRPDSLKGRFSDRIFGACSTRNSAR